MSRWRLTLDVALDATTPDAATRALYDRTEELRAALDVSIPSTAPVEAEAEHAAEHALLDAIEHALRVAELPDGTPVLRALDAPTAPAVTLVAAERQVLQAALDRAGGRVAVAARLAGIGRTTMYTKIRELDLVVPREAP